MAPWKLPAIVAAIAVPIGAAFALGGPGLGVAVGALASVVLLVVAVRQGPRGPIGEPAGPGEGRHLLVVVTRRLEEPEAVAEIAAIAGDGEPAEVLVLAPARIGFLDRWASDVEGARRKAQENLVATVAALAKAGIAAEARVGDEDVVQAVEDQLQSFPANEVLLIDDEAGGDGAAAEELRSRLRAEFRRLALPGVSRRG